MPVTEVPVNLRPEHIPMAAQACRAKAAQLRNDAARQKNPVIRDPLLESAEQYEELARVFERAGRVWVR